jgi:hypothetical protein
VARIIGDRSRAHDVVARYGGEEFAISLPETALEGAHTFGDKLRIAVEGVSLDGGDPLTISRWCGLTRDEYHRDQPTGGRRRRGSLPRQVDGPQSHLLGRLFLSRPPAVGTNPPPPSISFRKIVEPG